jgi:hypothetical protein
VVGGLARGDEIVTAGSDVLADGAGIRAVRGVDPFAGKPESPPTAARQP